jgi:hypothetical protein
MFSKNPSNVFHQGDILDKVYYMPVTFLKYKAGQIPLPQSQSIRHAYLVLLSNCCDLQWYTDDQGNLVPRRRYILIAPLSLTLPYTKPSEEYNMLIENGRNQPENDPVQFFYYKKNTVIGDESVVDFSAMMSIRSAALRDIGINDKLLELDVEHRHLLRTRLHQYFSRVPEEEWEEVTKLF